jgi:hypothetical protein
MLRRQSGRQSGRRKIHRKKMTAKILISVSAVVVALFIITSLHLPDRKRIREQVFEKYRDYRPLSEITKTEHYEIVVFESEHREVTPPFYDPNGDIFFSMERQKPESDDISTTYYKIDRHGAVVDTLSSHPGFSERM